MPRSQRILLIGSTGQVGWELVRSLRSLGELTHTSTKPSGELGVRDALALDLADGDAIRAMVRDANPTIIVNAAAYTAVDKAEQEPELAAKVNAVAPGVLAEEARRVGAALVHYSTDYVFDGSGTRPWRENDPVAPLGEYGRTKLAGEEAIRAAGAAHLILRTSWVYGVRGNNFVRTMLRFARERAELRVVSDQVGAPTSARCLCDVTCLALAQVLRDPAEMLAERGGVFHVACGGETSWHAFAEEIFRQARSMGMNLAVERVTPITTAEYHTPARRPLNSRLDRAKLREAFGLCPPDWSTALAETLPLLARHNFSWS